MIGLAGKNEGLVVLVEVGDRGAARNAAGTHTAGNDRRVRGHTAADRQNTLRRLHTLDVLGRGLKPNENDLLALRLPRLGVLGGEDDLAARGAGRRGERLGDDLRGLDRLGVELRVKQGVEVARVDHQNRLLLVDHTLVHEVAGDLESGGSGALTVAALEHIEFAVLDGELHILHIAVVILERLADVDELLVGVGELLFHLGDGHRGTNAGDDVLALRVGQELAHQFLFAGRGVAGEGDAGAGVVVQVTEDHRHHVDGGAPGVGDVVVAAIDVGAGVVPGTEDGADRGVELFLRVGREVLAELLLVFRLELVGKLFQVGGGQFNVELDALLFLHLVDQLLEVLFADLHNDVREHLDKPTVGVVDEPLELGIGVARDHRGDDVVVQTEVQNGVHHTGHRGASARTHRNEKRVLEIAELLAVDLLHDLDVLHDLRHDLVVDLSAVLVVLRARLGRDREALRNGKTDVGHLRQVRALTAEEVAHVFVAFREEVHVFLCHLLFLSPFFDL